MAVFNVVAHNFDKGSFTIELEWPSMRVLNTLCHDTSGIHDIWIRDDDGMKLSCDTMNSGLIDLVSGSTLWRTESHSLTRGLAAIKTEIYVGSSERSSSRELRGTSETGIWVVDSSTMKTKDYHWLGQFGCVHQIRVADQLDLCHPVGPLAPEVYSKGVPVAEYWRAKRLDSAQRLNAIDPRWHAIVGVPDIASIAGPITLKSGEFSLVVRRDVEISDGAVSGRHSLPASVHEHCALVGRYSGPGDENMVAVLFLRGERGQASLSLWTNSRGNWHNLATKLHNLDVVDARLVMSGNDAKLFADGQEILSTTIELDIPASGRVGIRGIGGGVSNFDVQPG